MQRLQEPTLCDRAHTREHLVGRRNGPSNGSEYARLHRWNFIPTPPLHVKWGATPPMWHLREMGGVVGGEETINRVTELHETQGARQKSMQHPCIYTHIHMQET